MATKRSASTVSEVITHQPVLKLRRADGQFVVETFSYFVQNVSAEHVTDRFKALCQHTHLPQHFDRVSALNFFLQRLTIEPDTDCRAKVIEFLNQIGLEATVWADAIAPRLRSELKRAQPVEVVCALLQTYLSLVKRHSFRMADDMDRTLARLLRHSSHRIRSTALLFLASLQDTKWEFIQEIPSVISRFAADPDPRVRKTSLEALLMITPRRDVAVNVTMYTLVVHALKDDFEEVRMAATKLLRVFAALFPQHILDSGSRLVDDAFVKACDRVNDSSIHVRTEACRHLGSFREVSESLLDQTLSKQIMSHLRKKQSYQEEEKAKMGFSSRSRKNGKVQISSSNDKDVSQEEISLLESGACGAFVHGLEDEFELVRSASIESICRLSLISDDFADRALDFLVDMFSDEIDEVRMRAIRALRLIGEKHQIRLRQDQLSIVLAALEDFSPTIRTAVHDLLGAVRVADVSCLRLTVTTLLTNLQRYPQDSPSLLHCFRCIGRQHAHQAEFLVEELLKQNKRFLTPEAPLSDDLYRAVLVFLLNASSINVDIAILLPKHVFRHYLFLRRLHPSLFLECPLRLWRVNTSLSLLSEELEREVEAGNSTFSTANDDDGGIMFARATSRLHGLIDMAAAGRVQESQAIIRSTLSDLEYLRRVSHRYVGPSAWLEGYFECFAELLQTKKQLTTGGDETILLRHAHNLLTTATSLLHSFHCHGISNRRLPPSLLLPARSLQLYAHVVTLLGTIQRFSDREQVDQLRVLTEALVARVDQMRVEIPSSSELLKQLQAALASPFIQADTVLDALWSFLEVFWPERLSPSEATLSALRRCSATIDAPIPHPEKPIEFVATMLLEIQLKISFKDAADLANIAVEVVLPDQSIQFFWPRLSQFTPISAITPDQANEESADGNGSAQLSRALEGHLNWGDQEGHVLNLPIYVLNATWTDSSDIRVRVVHVYYDPATPLLSHEQNLLDLPLQQALIDEQIGSRKHHKDGSSVLCVPLSPSITYPISPKKPNSAS